MCLRLQDFWLEQHLLYPVLTATGVSVLVRGAKFRIKAALHFTSGLLSVLSYCSLRPCTNTPPPPQPTPPPSPCQPTSPLVCGLGLVRERGTFLVQHPELYIIHNIFVTLCQSKPFTKRQNFAMTEIFIGNDLRCRFDFPSRGWCQDSKISSIFSRFLSQMIWCMYSPKRGLWNVKTTKLSFFRQQAVDHTFYRF